MVKAVQFWLFCMFGVTQYSKSNSTANEKVKKKVYKCRMLGDKERLESSTSDNKQRLKGMRKREECAKPTVLLEIPDKTSAAECKET